MYRYSLNPTKHSTLEEKIAVCRSLCIPALELDGTVDGTAFHAMTNDQIEDARQLLIGAGVAVVLAQLNCDLNDDAAVRSWFRTAQWLGVENVLFPAPAEGETELTYLARLERPFAYAKSYGMGRLLTHSKEGLLATEEGLTQVVKSLDGAGVIVDPMLQAALGHSAYMDCCYKSRLKNAIFMIRATDGLNTGEAMLPGAGVAQVREFVSLMLARSFGGYFSVAPYGGYELPQIIDALRAELKRM